MNAREYVEQIKDINEIILSLHADIEQKEEEAQRVTRGIKTILIPSRAKDRMTDAIDEYVDIERGELKKFISKRQEILDTMKLLPAKEYLVLFRRYALGFEFHEIATAHNRSESWAKSMVKIALDDLQKVLDEQGGK